MTSWDDPLPEAAPADHMAGALVAEYVVPPLSVLDSRQGYWQERRRRWLSLGIASELGRGDAYVDAQGVAHDATAPGGSLMMAASKGPDGKLIRGDARGRPAQRFQGANNVSAQAAALSGGWEGHGSGGNGSAAAFQLGTMRDGTVVGTSGAGKRWSGANHDDMLKRGLQSGEGRELQPGGNLRSEYGAYDPGTASPGTSIFDPVLCELVYRWWCPPGGRILDPFAGGSVRGIVAARMGHPYTGIDLSARQVDANREQARTLLQPGDPVPEWIVGDSANLEALLPAGERYDLVFSCPPYYDLEVYSDHPADLSAMASFPEFLAAFKLICKAAVARLNDGRFAVMVVSEVRGKRGIYHGLVPHTVAALSLAGAAYYNEAILVNSVGSLPLRVGKYMSSSRKLGRTHQNVIVGVKGDPAGSRGWDIKREDPADPQLALFGVPA